MKLAIKWFSLVLIATLFLAGCTTAAKPNGAGKTAGTPKVLATPRQIQVTAADQGDELTLIQGDSLILVLESNPSTGYAWEVETVDSPVLQLSGEAVFKADSERLGSPGKSTLTFNTLNSGTQVLTLIYHRPSVKDAQPKKTFTINVTVTAPAAGSNQPKDEISYPAAKYCADRGLPRETRTAVDGSEYGVCKFPGGSECDERAYFRGECKAGQFAVAPTPVIPPAAIGSN